jgi:AsmA protein
MRILIRVVVALGVLLVLAAGALVWLLPGIASSDAVRARVEQAAAEATGQEVRFAGISFGLLPPRLVVSEPRIGPEAQSLAQAERVDLRLSLLPLLARTVVVDSLVVDGARVRLVRTADGIQLPGSEPGGTEPSTATDAQPASEGGSSSFSLAVAELQLRDSNLILEDRSVAPPVVWEIQDLSARARGHSLDDPVEIEANARLASGGAFRLAGSASPSGSMDLGLDLENVALAPAAVYAGKGSKLSGAVSGDVHAKGSTSSDLDVTADLVVEESHLELEDMLFSGRIGLQAELAGAAATLSGPVRIDATGAHVRYGGFFEKPVGTEATASGRLVPEPDGSLGLRDLHLKIKNFKAEAQLESRAGPGSRARSRLELDAAPFSLKGWGELVPPLAPYAPTGSLGFESLTVTTAPLDLGGRILLSKLGVTLPDGAPLQLSGALEAAGDQIRSQGLEGQLSGIPVSLDAQLQGLRKRPTYRVQAGVSAVEANDLVVALGGKGGTLEGPLTARADLRGPLDADEPLQALAGQVGLDVGQGRLRGVSLLRGTVDRLGALGEAALLAGARRGGRDLQRFYEDEFESITGNFAIGGGRARTDDLRIVYRQYAVDLRGALGLLDGSLDLTGDLTISEDVDEALTGVEGGGKSKVIPLARVVGSVDAPRVTLSRDAVLALATRQGRDRDEVQRKIDDALGEGSGKQVLDALEGLLGGRKR